MYLEQKKAILIGETNLCIQCAKHLIDNGWHVVMIISDDSTVTAWAINNSISALPTSKLNIVKENNFYLFSIINHYLIPKSFLEDNNIILALNYHDSSLPRYAGINSTTWAIINNEKTHGVTLHQIKSGIDDGDIVAQALIKIEKDETAQSLNLKCSEQLLLIFKETISKIESNILTYSKQNLENRTYYGYSLIPDNYGLINGIPNTKMYNLIRGLTFGSGYDNQVATVKIFIDGKFYILEDFNFKNMSFSTVKDIYGNKIDIKITHQDRLVKHELSTDSLKYLSNIRALEKKNKKQTSELLTQLDASISILDHISSSPDDINHMQEITIPDCVNTTTAFTIIYLVLARFFYNSNFIVSLYASNQTIPEELQGLVESSNFIHINSNKLSHGFNFLENYLTNLQKDCHITTKDFGYRYGLQLLTDIAIITGEVKSTNKHKIIIRIEDNKIVIAGISAKLQINSLFESINFLINQDIEEIKTKDLNSICILSDFTYNQIVYEFNKTDKEYSKEKTIHKLFEEQVLRTPISIAIVYEGTRLTYQELNKKANQLANYLIQNYQIKPDDLIALCLDRSENMLIAILGVLKSGGAYVPLDPDYPNDRIAYILNDIRPNAVLTEDAYKEKLLQITEHIGKKIDILAIDSEKIQIKLGEQKPISPITLVTSASSAYVIYTSGTTGNPKGVMVEHKSVVNTLLSLYDIYDFNKGSKSTAFTSYTFDVSVSEFFVVLFRGAELHLLSEATKKDILLLSEYIKNIGINYVYLPPVLLSILPRIEYESLRGIIYAGEPCDKETGKYWSNKYALYNYYGPTEATIYATGKQVLDGDTHLIGPPIFNAKCYILDKNLFPLPIGLTGELYIGGAGVARGYLKRYELTERFIINPFQTPEEKLQNKNDRLYKTGDLVRWLPDRNIEYIGRNDSQVKIRGYRIELGEIENKLLNYPDIKQAIVLAKEHAVEQTNTKYLLAYYVSDNKLDEDKIQSYLATQLPEYMLPQTLIHINKLPITISGKLNKKALPEPKLANQSECTAIKNELENNIRKLYAQVLNLPVTQIGIKSDFFKMGGDSISGIQLVSQIRQQLGLNVNVKDIFTYGNIEQLLTNVLANKNIQKQCLIKTKQEDHPIGSADLLPIQEWFFNNIKNGLYQNHHYWNQSFIIKTPSLDLKQLKASIIKLVAQHDALRLRYKLHKDGNYIQYYDTNVAAEKLKTLNICTLNNREATPEFAMELQNILTNWQSNFNLEHGPMYSIGYIHGYNDGSSRIHFALHHLITDSVSWRIIAEDLQNIYHQKELKPKGSSYRQWVNVVNKYAQANTEENIYWKKVLSDYRIYELDKLVKNRNIENLANLEFNVVQTNFLLRDSNKAYHTKIDDLLLTALAYTLTTLTNNKIHHITLEGHGREEMGGEVDITRTIGWFTTMYPVRLEVMNKLSDSIKTIKENLHQIPNKGIGYGALIGYKLITLPGISFNYLGQFDSIKSDSSWHIVGENSGITISRSNKSSNIIDINGWIVGGKLKFTILSRLNKKITNDIAKSFKHNLENIIDHCINITTVEYTASDFVNVMSEADLVNLPLIPNPSRYDWFDMTEMQKAYLIGELGNYEIGNISNHIYSEYYYQTIDVSRLENVINLLVEKYDVLRTVYSIERLQQRSLRLDEISKYQIKINDYSQNILHKEMLESIRERLSSKAYDNSTFPLFTFEVSKFKDVQILHVSMNLILLDVQSRKMFFDLIDNIYRDNAFQVKLPSITFKDYQNYYRLLKYSSWYQKDKAYWGKKITSMPLRPELPFKMHPKEIEKPLFNDHTLCIEKSIWDKFKEKTREHNVSYSSVLLGLYGSIISYFSGHKEFLITVTLFNRYAVHKEINNIWGDFTSVNLFHYIDFGSDLVKILERTHSVMWENINHVLYSGLEVQREIAKYNRIDNGSAVSPIVFTGIIGNKRESSYLEDSESLNERSWCAQTSQAWIDVQAIETNGIFMSKWIYVSQLFEESYIESLNRLYCQLITYLAEHNWEHSVSIPYIPSADKVLIKGCNSAAQESSDDTLFGRYERVVIENSLQHRFAVADAINGKNYSYKELLQESDLFAKYIFSYANTREQNKTKNKLIGILSENGYNQVISALAVMKSGCGYLPLCVDWPEYRLDKILEQGNVTTVLISRSQTFIYKALLPDKYSLLIIEDVLEKICNNKELILQLEQVSLPKVSANDVAYVIFTSGSTGIPKGVTIAHRGALNTIDSVNNKFNVTKHDKVLAISELSFDLSVYDIFGLLAVGGTIVFPAQHRIKEPKYWLELIKQYQITIWNTVPQLADLLIDEVDTVSNLDIFSLRLFLLSGDWLPIKLPDRIKQYCVQAKVISLGGATEGSIWSIWYEIDKAQPDWVSIPYGVAMPNQKMYVLNYCQQHCPVGVIGEIYIGGVGVALNYWQDKTRTDNSFINHSELGRLYKTGDLGKWNRSGYIEFIGRQDNQTKIRGYRIELDEIEKKLIAYPGITQAVILVRGHVKRGKYLIAYYASVCKLDDNLIKDYLKKKLPDYMTPNILVHLEQLPLTSNGKLDLAVLDTLADSRFDNADNYVAPSNDIEYKICIVYAEILGLPVDQISVNDSFFALGGDSITAIRATSKLQQYLKINLSDLFQLKTSFEIAKKTQATDNNLSLQHKLEKLKLTYRNQKITKADIGAANLKRNKYLQKSSQFVFKQQCKNIQTVLLTGATGFLGCNILYQLLTVTNYKIYLLIRGDSGEHSYNRLKKKFNFYFDIDIHNYIDRVVVLKSDLEQPSLGLEDVQYQDLTISIDSIIHAAALVKHYGSYEAFYKANVQTTINLLELAKLTPGRDFHYISTNGIFLEGYIPNFSYYVFTEDCTPEILAERNNLYLKTKYEAELVTRNYRQHGITSNIYRVGNLTAHSTNYRNQENIKENAFLHCVETMLDLKMTTKEFSLVEMSPVDCAALGVIKIFDQVNLSNQIYHIFNPNLCDLHDLFSAYDDLNIKKVTVDKFIDMVLHKLSNSNNSKQIELFILHRRLLEAVTYTNFTNIKILQDKTCAVLDSFGVKWPKITNGMLYEIVQKKRLM